MLLPSALPCDRRPALRCVPQFNALPFSPPITPPSQFSANVTTSCRVLQSLLGVQAPPSRSKSQTSDATNAPLQNNSRVKKRPPPPPPPSPRGHKRHRDEYESGDEGARPRSSAFDQEDVVQDQQTQPSTPKRQRRAPPNIPFGLDRRDFYNLPSTPRASPSPQFGNLSLSAGAAELTPNQGRTEDTACEETEGESEWDDDDDRMLVKMMLERLKPSWRQWHECAREMGADQKGLAQRWKYLIDEGQVGLKFRRGGMRKRGDVREVFN